MFDFFGLSRELRDLIYGSLLDNTIHLPPALDVQVRVTDGPRKELMLVSKQISHEYQEALERCSAIVYVDTGSNLPTKATVGTLPRTFTSIRHLEFRLWLACSNVHDAPSQYNVHTELQFHLAWLRPVVAQMQSPSVFMLVELEAKHADICTTTLLCDYKDLIGIRGSRELLITQGKCPYLCKAEGKPEEPDVIFRYNRTLGQLDPMDSKDTSRQKALEDFGFAQYDGSAEEAPSESEAEDEIDYGETGKSEAEV